MRWLKRDSIVKISVIITVLMTIVVSMNLIELLDKYVEISLNPNDNVRYEHQEIKELHYTIPNPYESGNAIGNDVVAKDKAEIKQVLNDFLSNMPEFLGNVSIPLISFKLNEGVDVNADVLIAYNESLPYKIDSVSSDNNGIYLGNSYNGYWTGDSVTLNGENVKVAGVISSAYLRLDNSVIIPYKALNSLAKERFLDSITSDIFYDRKIPIVFASNLDNVLTHDIQLMIKYISNSSLLEITSIGNDTVEEIEAEKDDTPTIYSIIKKVVCVVSAAFCFIAVFEVIRLFLNRKKNDITILWSMGTKRSVIYRMIIRELGLSLLVGSILAFISEYIIYGMVMKCSVATVFWYGAYACIMVLFIAFIMMIVITNKILRKCIINVEKD